MNTIDGSTVVLAALISLLLAAALYVWTALALGAVFRKSGEEAWKGWVPIYNQVILFRLGGISPWLLLLWLVPSLGALAVWVFQIVACHTINRYFGLGAGMTVLAALVLPAWASVVGWGSARWVGDQRDDAASGASRDAASAELHSPPTQRLSPVMFGDPVAPEAPGGGFAPQSDGEASRPSTPSDAPSGFAPPAAERPTAGASPSGDWAVPADAGGLISSVPKSRPSSSAPESTAAPAAPTPDIDGAAPAPAADPEALQQERPEAPQSAKPAGDERAADVASRRADGRYTSAPLDDDEDWAVTSAPYDAPAPKSAVRSETDDYTGPPPGVLRSRSTVPYDAPDDATLPPVTRVPADPPTAPDREPWAPSDPDAFPEASGPVSAVVGAPQAGTPRSARGSVSSFHTRPEIPDEDIDETVIARRRRTNWALVLPSGDPIDLISDVVLVGRRPSAHAQHPGAQLVAVDDGTVSKTHARLERRNDRWYITDLDSTNGVTFATLVGTEVEATPGVETEAGDRFLLGDAEVRLVRSDG